MLRVLVVGVPRGGTTWVGKALGNSDATAYVHEPDGTRDPMAFRHRALDRQGQFDFLNVGDLAPEYERLWDGAFSGGRARRSMYARLVVRALDGLPREERNAARLGNRLSLTTKFVLRGARPLLPRRDVDAVVVKSVHAAMSLEWIYGVIEDLRVLVVAREPRNVLASHVAIGFGPPAPLMLAAARRSMQDRWGLEIKTPEAPMAHSALLCVCLMLGLHDGLRRHPEWQMISHERACEDPHVALARTAESLGLRFGDRAKAFVSDSDREGTGYETARKASELADKWKERLTSEDVDVIENVLEQVPRELWQVPQPQLPRS